METGSFWHSDITPSAFARFWAKVDRSAGTAGCWRYAGYHRPNGYPEFHLGGHAVKGHRFAFISILGNPPPHLPFVIHKCPAGSQRWCVNLAHLAPGTKVENMADCIRENRIARGERHGMHTHPAARARGTRSGAYTHPESRTRGERSGTAKLTAVQVQAIKHALAAGQSRVELARLYGVARATIWGIEHGRGWAHVRGDDGR